MGRTIALQASAAEPPFRINLEAGTIGSCELSHDVLSLRVAQHVNRGDAAAAELWNSVSVFCEKEPSGALVVRVLVFNPDWEGGLQIAELRSWPSDFSSLTPLGCNLDHIGP
jgi:hypothetical protein